MNLLGVFRHAVVSFSLERLDITPGSLGPSLDSLELDEVRPVLSLDALNTSVVAIDLVAVPDEEVTELGVPGLELLHPYGYLREADHMGIHPRVGQGHVRLEILDLSMCAHDTSPTSSKTTGTSSQLCLMMRMPRLLAG